MRRHGQVRAVRAESRGLINVRAARKCSARRTCNLKSVLGGKTPYTPFLTMTAVCNPCSSSGADSKRMTGESCAGNEMEPSGSRWYTQKPSDEKAYSPVPQSAAQSDEEQTPQKPVLSGVVRCSQLGSPRTSELSPRKAYVEAAKRGSRSRSRLAIAKRFDVRRTYASASSRGAPSSMIAPMSPANLSTHLVIDSCSAHHAASFLGSISWPVMRKFSEKSSGHSSCHEVGDAGGGSSSGSEPHGRRTPARSRARGVPHADCPHFVCHLPLQLLRRLPRPRPRAPSGGPRAAN
eukprot:scaffold17568_cov33-Tisochrysis_lutea.AAC.4